MRWLTSSVVRWNLVGLVVVAALVVALWPRGQGLAEQSRAAAGASQSQGQRPSAVPVQPSPSTPVPAGELVEPRAAADLPPCPAPTAAAPSAPSPSGDVPLAGLVLECLGDGSTVDLGTALAGRPALLNLWAWNCPPCEEELPVLQQYAAQAGDAITVLTVHSNPASPLGLETLAELGVRLPAVQDPGSRIAALVGAPQVLPVTVLLRADGTVAQVLPIVYTSPQEIAADVQEHLGLPA